MHCTILSLILKPAFDSNHTCCIDGIGLGITDKANNHVASPENARKRKVYSILSSRHRDEVSSFHLNQELGGENDDYSLIPMVLACAHLYSEVEYKRTEQLRNQRWGLYPMCTQEQDGAVEPLSLM